MILALLMLLSFESHAIGFDSVAGADGYRIAYSESAQHPTWVWVADVLTSCTHPCIERHTVLLNRPPMGSHYVTVVALRGAEEGPI